MNKTENKQYKLKRWYPTLPNDWKTEHDYVYYKEESLMVNKLLMTTHIINFKHLEYRDFWEEVKQPLFITEDGVKLSSNIVTLYAVDLDNQGIESPEWDFKECEKMGLKIFYYKKNADKYIEENKPKPLFVTEDGVEINKNYGGWLYRISKDFKREVLPISPEMEVEGYKVFAHPENADEYIWRNKPLFSYEDIRRFTEHEGVCFDIKGIAKERSKQ